jgi:hypothetical protein
VSRAAPSRAAAFAASCPLRRVVGVAGSRYHLPQGDPSYMLQVLECGHSGSHVPPGWRPEGGPVRRRCPGCQRGEARMWSASEVDALATANPAQAARPARKPLPPAPPRAARCPGCDDRFCGWCGEP